MLRRFHNRIAISAVLVLGLLTGLLHWIAPRRPILSEFNSSLEFAVTSPSDHGAGSLREAIFAADTASGRARIVFRVPRVELSSPLPPLVNPSGIVLEGPAEGVELQARNIRSGPVLDVNSARSVLRGIRIENAPEQGILVRSSGFHLLDAKISGCDVGLQAAEGAKDFVVERTEFEQNRIGMRLESTVSEIVLRDNQFRRQRDAGLWAVRSRFEPQSGPGLVVKENLFDGNRFGAVVGNISALIVDNEFLSSVEAAVFLIGQGAKIQGNRIRNGVGTGVFADVTQGTIIEGNELDHNGTIGVLVRYSRDTLVEKNRVYANGYGIALVLGQVQHPSMAIENTLISQLFDGFILIGDSPVLRNNQALGNRAAGLRILDFLPQTGDRVVSDPYLDRNALKGNAFDDPVRGEYRDEHKGRSQ